MFLVPEVGFVSKVHWWCLKQSAISLHVFKVVFALDFLTLSFLCWLLVLLVLLVCVFFFTSSCCCFLFQVSMFWFLFMVLLVSWVLVCAIFWISFLFLFFEVWGQVRWLGPSLLVLFCFWFVLFVFVLLFGFVFLIWLTGFKGQVRLPKGRPHLAPNPPY